MKGSARRWMAGLALPLLAGGLLAACTTAPQSTGVSLTDGAQGRLIDCSGFRQSMHDCLEAARAECDGDYEVVARSGQWQAVRGIEGVVDHFDRAIIVRCDG